MEMSFLIKFFYHYFHQRLESIQDNAALAIAEASRGISKEKFFQERYFESLRSRRWFRKLSHFYKIINQSPVYLNHLIPNPLPSYSTRNSKNSLSLKLIKVLKTLFSIHHHHRIEQIRFEYSFFSFLQIFQKIILEFIGPLPNRICNVPNSLGLTYLTRLSVGLSRLCEHKFRHNFRDSPKPICNWGSAFESTKHYLLYCSNFKERQSFLQNDRIVNPNLLSMNEDALTQLLLYGNNAVTNNTNIFLLNSEAATRGVL